jgi:hypothetical protein
VIYVFVCLNGAVAPPDYYVCTAPEVRATIKQYATRGIVDLSRIRKTDALDRWDKIESSLIPIGRRRPAMSPKAK